MDMIFYAPDLYRGHFMVSRDTANVRPDALLNFQRYPGKSIFCGKDQMVIE